VDVGRKSWNFGSTDGGRTVSSNRAEDGLRSMDGSKNVRGLGGFFRAYESTIGAARIEVGVYFHIGELCMHPMVALAAERASLRLSIPRHVGVRRFLASPVNETQIYQLLIGRDRRRYVITGILGAALIVDRRRGLWFRNQLAGQRSHHLPWQRFDQLPRQRRHHLARQRFHQLAGERLHDLAGECCTDGLAGQCCRVVARQSFQRRIRSSWRHGYSSDDTIGAEVLRLISLPAHRSRHHA